MTRSRHGSRADRAAAKSRPRSARKMPTPSHQLELVLPGEMLNSPALAKRRAKPVVGWHGMSLARLEVDWHLAAKLAPDGVAVKVMVAARSPARKAGIRSGDYVISVSLNQHADTPLPDFESGKHPAGSTAFVKYHRPTWRDPRHVELALVTLSAPPGPRKQKWWERLPRCEPGQEVLRDQRKYFLGQMAAYPHIKPIGFRILTRMLHHYQGSKGICPSYASIQRDLKLKRRQTVIEHMHALAWVGVVEVTKGGGFKLSTGATNSFSVTWPSGWNVVSFPSKTAAADRQSEPDPKLRELF